MPEFTKRLERLNADQRRAVETIEGPVMVVAGPGTGKTEVVAMRVGNILRRTHMKPSNILCLTFSGSGAVAMRERLRSLIGADAYGVTVSTIHGFCHSNIIQTYPEVFDDFSDIEHITDVQRFQLVNEIIDALPVDAAIVSPKDRYGRTADILARISQIKREGITRETLQKVTQEYRLEMESKSKPTTKAHRRNLRLAQQCEEFVFIFKRYQELLKERGLYDYDDMILFVNEELKEEDWMLANLQERYMYILVDEYQDTNGAQNRFLKLLTTTPEGVGQPNICVVGDDDQAIYRFQGASVRSMVDFVKRFPLAPVITLSRNYRSTQEILDAAGHMIAKNNDRLVGKVEGVQKDLVSSIAKPHGEKPMLLRPVSDAVEAAAIGEHMCDFALNEKIAFGDMALLTRTNFELIALYDGLRTMDIPVQMTGKLDLLAQPKVLECITLLKAVADPRSDSDLAAGMACTCFACHPADLGMTWSTYRERNYVRMQEKKSWQSLLDFLLLIDTASGGEFLAQLRRPDALLAARDLILDLSQKQASKTLPDLIESLLKNSGLLPDQMADIVPLDYVALQEFFAYVKRRCGETVTFSLVDLLSEIEYRQTYGLRLTFSMPHIVDDAVQLMTAHGSKGLEFDAVFLASFREKHWDHKRGSNGLSLPDHLLFAGDDEEDLDLEDERRLTYVAWTRAKQHLVLSCPLAVTRGDRAQDVSPSQFFSEGGALPEIRYDLKDTTKALTLLRPTIAIDMDEQLRTFLRKQLETFELSVTALNNFLKSPQTFLWEDLLRVPKAKKSVFAYGSAVHSALREWGNAMRKRERMPLEDFLKQFSDALTKHEIITEKERPHWLGIGERALPVYYAERLASDMPFIVGIEKSLHGRHGDIRLKGILDRFDLYHDTGKNVHIIDYKTGTPKTEKQVREDYDGSTYRQLVFYKLLSGLSPDFGGYEATEFSLDFIGEGEHEPKRLIFEIPQKEVDELAELIRKVWAKISALDFSPVE